MNLDGKHFSRIEKLQQDREAARCSCPCSEELLRRHFDQLTEGASLERSIDYFGRVVWAITEEPSLADGRIS
jgi:hypothetical protein